MAVIMTVKTSTCSKYFCPPTCSYRCFFIPATCVTSHKSMSFTVLGVEDGDGDYYDGDGLNKPHQISTLVIFFELEFHNDWLVVRGLGGMVEHLFAFPDLLCC